MLKDQVRQLLKKSKIDFNEHADYFSCKCPFARHSEDHKGEDKNPSFSVSLKYGSCRCFTCGYRAKLEDFFNKLGGEEGLSFDLEFLELFVPEEEPYSRPNVVVTEKVLDRFIDSKTPIRNYLSKREFPINLDNLPVKLYYDTHWSNVMMPIRNEVGELIGITSRNTKKGGRKSHHYLGVQTAQCLLGHELTTGEKPIIVVEGMTDVLNVYDLLKQTGLNYEVVGLLGCSMSKWQADKLMEIEVPIFLALDLDKAGKKGTVKAKKLLKECIFVSEVRWNDPEVDLGSMSPDLFRKLFE